jgi:MYXO-CTERM domain-containing protein
MRFSPSGVFGLSLLGLSFLLRRRGCPRGKSVLRETLLWGDPSRWLSCEDV